MIIIQEQCSAFQAAAQCSFIGFREQCLVVFLPVQNRSVLQCHAVAVGFDPLQPKIPIEFFRFQVINTAPAVRYDTLVFTQDHPSFTAAV